MPRIFSFDEMSEEQVAEMEAREDDMDFDPYAAPPSAFQYILPPDFGGPPPPVRVAVRPDQAEKEKYKPSLIDRLLKVEQGSKDRHDADAYTEGMAARLTEAMTKVGVVRAYCRYDGGNEEGFAWFEHAVLKDGSTRNASELIAEMKKAGAFAAAGVHDHFDYALDDRLAGYWAATLLGRSFGTGEHVMYGALWVDLETGIVTDDPDAAPIVKNITLKPE